MTVKIVKLTALNVRALDECKVGIPALIETTASTAEFTDVEDAVRQVQTMILSLPGRSHPKASLHAVLRKLVALLPPASPEMLAQLRTDVSDEVVDRLKDADLSVAEPDDTTPFVLDSPTDWIDVRPGAHDPACPGPVMAPVFGLPGPRECMACGWTS
jgi:hypothetical protein